MLINSFTSALYKTKPAFALSAYQYTYCEPKLYLVQFYYIVPSSVKYYYCIVKVSVLHDLVGNNFNTPIRAYYTPTTKCGGAILDSLCRVGPSVGRSVSNSCPLYNSFTNGRISFKLE